MVFYRQFSKKNNSLLIIQGYGMGITKYFKKVVMIGTFIGILTSLLFLYNPSLMEKFINWNFLTFFFIGFSMLFLFLETLSLYYAFSPLQRATQNITPHLLNLLKKDRKIYLLSCWFFIFAFLSLLLASGSYFKPNISLIIWLILFGISFDVLKYHLNHLLKYFNPFAVIDLLKKQGARDIRNEKEIDLCDTFDSLTEVSIKAINNTDASLANYSLNAIQDLSRNFLEGSKSLSHEKTDSQLQALGIQDKVTYTLSYLFQKIDFLFHRALKEKLETVLSYLMTTIGKIAIHSAKYDLTLSIYPISLIGKCAVKSIENKFPDIGIRATLILLEIAKTIVSEIDLTYLEIQQTFLCITGQLENIAKDTFKQDKNIKIPVLIQPLLELKELFNTEKMAGHQDTQAIIQDLSRVIAEFQILETVMRTIPPINPSLETK